MNSVKLTSRQITTGTIILAALALFFVVNIFSNLAFRSLRFDLTENNLFTLSEGTKNILSGLDEPIDLTLYVSKKLATTLPGISSYTLRVEELLEEFERRSNGKIDLTVIDPEPFSEEEDRAVAAGLQAVPVNDGASTFYFGLVGTNSTDKEEIIPFFSPEREEFLEYDLAKLIYTLATPKQPIVGVMSSLSQMFGAHANPFQGGRAPAWVVMEQIEQLFEVRRLDTDVSEIPEDIDVLMLVHPKKLPDKTLYAIDQFVLRGGRALVFVDPYAEVDQPPGASPITAAPGAKRSDLAKLFDKWGIRLTQKVVGDLASARKVQINQSGRPMIVDYPVWIEIDPALYDSNEIITANLGQLAFATAGHIETVGEHKDNVKPIVRSSADSMLVDTSKLGFLANPQDILRDFRPEGAYTLAARISGIVESAFPDGPPEADDETGDTEDGGENQEPSESETPAHLAKSKEPVNVIVVADVDMLHDQFWVQVQNFLGSRLAIPTAANGTFVANALDNLTGSNDLISVRNRGSFSRPFIKVRQLQLEAEQKFLAKEQELRNKLRETERKLRDLQSQKGDSNALVLSPEQRAEIERFRAQRVKIRKELRNVQHELKKNIDSLESWIKVINIIIVPLLVALAGVALLWRRNKRRNEVRSATATGGQA